MEHALLNDESEYLRESEREERMYLNDEAEIYHTLCMIYEAPLLLYLNHRLYMKMDDMTAPQKWSQNISITHCGWSPYRS